MEITANIWKAKIIVISYDDLNGKREQRVMPSGHALHNPHRDQAKLRSHSLIKKLNMLRVKTDFSEANGASVMCLV